MRWAGNVTRMGEMRNAHKILVGWEDNIRIYLSETGWECVDWIHLAQGRDQRRDLV